MASKTKEPLTETEAYYEQVLRHLGRTDAPFMLAGAFALKQYTGLVRDTKDMDLFCTPGDFPLLLQALDDAGYETEITDANWLAKARSGDYYVDLIFSSRNGVIRVDASWLERAPTVRLLGCKVKIVPPEELIWSKLYIADRYRFDGADVNHLILKLGRDLDWRRLLAYMDRDWELLLGHLMMFRFVYPSERDVVPSWLTQELLARVQRQQEMPVPRDAVCRGPLLSHHQYDVDLAEWGFRET